MKIITKLLILFIITIAFIPHNNEVVKSEEQIVDDIIERKRPDYHLNPKKQKVIAVSRDLKRKLKFGEKVRIKGAGNLDGIYYVRDLMNKRFRNKIDILINPDEDGNKFTKVKLYAVNKILK